MSEPTPRTDTAEARPEGGGWRIAVLWFAICVVAIQLVLAAALDALLLPDGATARNPTLRRLWVDYVLRTEPKRPGETLVVLITDSQGYGAEVDRREIYPTLLERRLEERLAGRVRVVNWGLFGGKAPEMIVLLAAAHRLDPDVTLVIGGARTFAERFRDPGEGEALGLGHFPSDVRYLVAYADVRRHLPDSFRAHYVRTNELIDAWLARLLPLYRYRDLPENMALPFRPLRPFLDLEEPYWVLPYRGRREGGFRDDRRPVVPYSEALVGELASSLGALPGRRVFVRGPVRPRYESPFFLIEAAPRFEAEDVEVWNLANEIATGHFLALNHLDEEGHEQMAELLAERLAP